MRVNIGADLNAMGEVTGLLAGGPKVLYVIVFGIGCAVLQVFMQYSRYVSFFEVAYSCIVCLFRNRHGREGALG